MGGADGKKGSAPKYAEPPPDPAGPTLARASTDFEEAARRLELSLTSCGEACRALASMERAAKQVCSLATADDRARCTEAEARLRKARGRVRSACGTCDGGPTTDPEAPLR